MSKLFYLLRLHRVSNGARPLNPSTRTLFNSCACFEDKDDKKDAKNEILKEKDIKRAQDKAEAKMKLENLLQLMMKTNYNEKDLHLKLARPRVQAQKKQLQQKAEFLKRKEETEKAEIGSKLADAASKVAETLGGDTKKTEMELLDLYLGRSKTNSEIESAKEFDSKDGQHSHEKSELSMKDLLLSLKVEKQAPEEQSRAYQVRVYRRDSKTVNVPRMPISRARAGVIEKIDLFGAEPLNIFTANDEEEKGPSAELVVWNFLQERDIRLSVTHPPNNIFEQLILWTEQGKIWKFPIDNEQDSEEKNVDFTEHVFLEHMLEPWCPSSGPIRHFMELVCVGLSKNPYLSVHEKHAHIIFYEHYFKHKNDLLVDLGMQPIKDRPQIEAQQQVM